MEKYQKHTSYVTFRLSPNLLNMLDDEAEAVRMSRSRFIREALIESLRFVKNKIDSPIDYLNAEN